MLTRDRHAVDFDRRARRYYESIRCLLTRHSFRVVRLSLFLSATIRRALCTVSASYRLTSLNNVDSLIFKHIGSHIMHAPRSILVENELNQWKEEMEKEKKEKEKEEKKKEEEGKEISWHRR